MYDAIKIPRNLESLDKLLQRSVENKPTDHSLRFLYATALAKQSRFHEASDQYAKVLKQSPDFLGKDLENIRIAFQKSGRMIELQSFFKAVDRKRPVDAKTMINDLLK